MQKKYLIPLNEFCLNHNIEVSFINSLRENGLIEPAAIKESGYIDAALLLQLEKFIRLYYEFDINLEGIETISHLLQRINSMQNEITELKNKLRLYETLV